MPHQRLAHSQQPSSQQASWIGSMFHQGMVGREESRSLHAEPKPFYESRFQQNFSRIPISSDRPVIQAKSNGSGDREEQKANWIARIPNSNALQHQQSNQAHLPEHLRTRIEALSGISMDKVRVHYNSVKPIQVQALAYTQGTNIHIAPGQEKYLAHEAWHVVQQQQGRVKPTRQMQGKAINDDAHMEREADVMSERILSNTIGQNNQNTGSATVVQMPPALSPHTIQRVRLLDLSTAQVNTYQAIAKWASKSSAKTLNLEKLLLHAPKFETFVGFMQYIKKEIASPALGFNEKKFYADSVNDYFTKFPTPVEGAATWGGATTNKLPTPSLGSITDKTEVVEETESPGKDPAVFTLNSSANKHYKHLKKGQTKLPRNADELLEYVFKNKSFFGKYDDHWTLQLGDVQTHKGYGEYELKPWSILLSSKGGGTWEVFHYGPTGMEKD